MIIADNSTDLLQFKGIYSITCSSGKRYIGHTKKSFIKRFTTHFEKLRSSNHVNVRLQNDWNDLGSCSFTFEVLQVLGTGSCFTCAEKYWIKEFNSGSVEFGYNTVKDPTKSPSAEPEVRKRISRTLKMKYKLGIIHSPEHTLFKKGIKVWNKGKHYESTDHLKVPKTITPKLRNKWRMQSEISRNNSPCVEVYKDDVYLGTWRSAKDLQEWSETSDNNLPIATKNGKPFRGVPMKYLQSVNISKSCKTGKPYKGLIFRFKEMPTHRAICRKKLSKIGEG